MYVRAMNQRFDVWKEYWSQILGAGNAASSRLLSNHWQYWTREQNSYLMQDQVTPQAADAENLESIREDLGACTRCKLSKTRRTIVFGEGNPQARLMFIGEGPGESEDAQGRPFVGKAGELLDKIIVAMGFQRADVYIANVVKCRPPGNRVPEPDEVEQCSPFLMRQVEVVNPEVIVALGATALKCLVGEDTKITKARGTFLDFRGRPLMPTYHPAYLLRNPDAKKEVWDDMKKVMAKLAGK